MLQKGRKPSTSAKSIGELGRVSKTPYLLNYVDDEAYRRRILTQHVLRKVRQRYREGQEEQLGALELIVKLFFLFLVKKSFCRHCLTYLSISLFCFVFYNF